MKVGDPCALHESCCHGRDQHQRVTIPGIIVEVLEPSRHPRYPGVEVPRFLARLERPFAGSLLVELVGEQWGLEACPNSGKVESEAA